MVIKARHSSLTNKSKWGEEKKRTLNYCLPNENGDLVPVCRTMFLNTLGISERQVRTALAKTNFLVLWKEKGGGGVQQERRKSSEDTIAAMKKHNNRFPRTEAHYCRKSNGRQYLSPDLTISKMYKMYKDETKSHVGSYISYCRVFRKTNLSFHRPKKDMCGMCDSYSKEMSFKRGSLETNIILTPRRKTKQER